MKIGIWIPTHDQRVSIQYAHQQMPQDLQAFARAGHNLVYQYASSCDLNGMRNQALEQAREQGFDFLCMQDADIYAEGGTLLKLVETCVEHDAVACVAAVATRQIERNRLRMNVMPFKVDDVFEVERAGTGIIAIDIRKVDKLAEEHSGPWFWREYTDERCTEQSVGQDIFFTYLVRSLGGKIMCNSKVETNHPHVNHEHLNYVPAIVSTVVPS